MSRIKNSQGLVLLLQDMVEAIGLKNIKVKAGEHPESADLPCAEIGDAIIYKMRPSSAFPDGAWCSDVFVPDPKFNGTYGDRVGLYCGTSMTGAVSEGTKRIVSDIIVGVLEDFAMGVDWRSVLKAELDYQERTKNDPES